ncbi:MAG TPA: hypothetical protein P5200_05430 [Tenuifilaceae bacterium]|nr:hypothetical protein [Tenuifilaceae bacterium]HPQ34395.1 hypothetical protein [Tenuifilaceae bacterium]HRX67791.1 hypothetical protein [Tenuifilaceae bacterium]
MAKGVKTGGRQKGTANKVTQDLRLLLKDFIAKEINNVDEQLKQAEPKDRLDFIAKLLPYALPKYDQVAFEQKNPYEQSMNFFQNITEKIRKKNEEYYGGKDEVTEQ